MGFNSGFKELKYTVSDLHCIPPSKQFLIIFYLPQPFARIQDFPVFSVDSVVPVCPVSPPPHSPQTTIELRAPPHMSKLFPLQCTLHVATTCMNGGWNSERGVRDFCLSMLHRLCLPVKSNVQLLAHRTQRRVIPKTMSCESSRWKI